MQGLPALAEQELAPFGEVISQLQQAVGGHFAAAQGGVFTSPEVAMAMDFLASQGAVAIGQTSWGPTGFCAVASQAQAETLVQQLQNQIRQQGTVETLDFIIASARNRGAEIICC
jgi:predicted sugar kinase